MNSDPHGKEKRHSKAFFLLITDGAASFDLSRFNLPYSMEASSTRLCFCRLHLLCCVFGILLNGCFLATYPMLHYPKALRERRTRLHWILWQRPSRKVSAVVLRTGTGGTIRDLDDYPYVKRKEKTLFRSALAVV